ncbi:MAG: hypothetical protein CM15mV42_1610 [uncultured marine virus]|nr:MAG: hypothetical protein CM15mV42_1610 [uncultured marine virus]
MYKEKKVPSKRIDDLQYTQHKEAAAAAQVSDAVTTKKVGQWVDELAVEEYMRQGWKVTGKNRMSYCAPEWIADKKMEAYCFLMTGTCRYEIYSGCNGISR